MELTFGEESFSFSMFHKMRCFSENNFHLKKYYLGVFTDFYVYQNAKLSTYGILLVLYAYLYLKGLKAIDSIILGLF